MTTLLILLEIKTSQGFKLLRRISFFTEVPGEKHAISTLDAMGAGDDRQRLVSQYKVGWDAEGPAVRDPIHQI
jgi:hypothetical protein